nr:putative uncharacterized protein FLJ45684 [Pan paniscus]
METANGEEPPAGPPVSLHGRRLLRVGGACPTPPPVLQRLPPSALHHALHRVPRRVCVSPLGQDSGMKPPGLPCTQHGSCPQPLPFRGIRGAPRRRPPPFPGDPRSTEASASALPGGSEEHRGVGLPPSRGIRGALRCRPPPFPGNPRNTEAAASALPGGI